MYVYVLHLPSQIDVPDGMTVSARQYISKSTMQYKLRLMRNHDEVQGQKVIVANDITKQNISVSN